MAFSQPQPPIELLRYPYPYRAAFTVASDVDSANVHRFRAVHALFCRNEIIPVDGADWRTLGLTRTFSRFDAPKGGLPGLGLDLADSFFLIGDTTTFGMYRYVEREKRFTEDKQSEENCAALIRNWLKEGAIDCYHTFLNYQRNQVEALLSRFFNWCDDEGVPKPRVWVNHSTPAAPTGLCPQRLQRGQLGRLARVAIRPLVGRTPTPLRYAFARYCGDKPDSPYYINDLLFANGLRYVWLNAGAYQSNRIALAETMANGRPTILKPVTMDDGVRYYEFDRCFASLGQGHEAAYLRDVEGLEALLGETALDELCRCRGTCILYTHWTHFRSLPIPEPTLLRFESIKRRHDAGDIWVTTTSKLLEWTRRRTFLEIQSHRRPGQLLVEIGEVDDPLFGRERLSLSELNGLAIQVMPGDSALEVRIVLNGEVLGPEQIHRAGTVYWVGDPKLSETTKFDRSIIGAQDGY